MRAQKTLFPVIPCLVFLHGLKQYSFLLSIHKFFPSGNKVYMFENTHKKYFNSIGKGTRKGGNRCDLTYARILETFNSTFSEQDTCRRAQFFLLLRLNSKVVCESGPDLSYRSNFLPDTYSTICVPKVVKKKLDTPPLAESPLCLGRLVFYKNLMQHNVA